MKKQREREDRESDREFFASISLVRRLLGTRIKISLFRIRRRQDELIK